MNLTGERKVLAMIMGLPVATFLVCFGFYILSLLIGLVYGITFRE